MGRRVQRTQRFGKESTKYIYDGQDVLADDNGGVLTKYLNGAGVDNKLRVQTGNDVKYFLSDHLGSTNGLTDASGNLTASTSYDSFGNATNANFPTRYQYTGREFDNFTGLYHYRARNYDAKIGRFISEDPIGLSGGINQFAYVWNSPLLLNDPSGLIGGWGNNVADWGDDNVNYAREWWRSSDPQHWIWNGSVDTVGDLSSGFCDMFRVGTGTGLALSVEDENGWGRAALVTQDIGRAAGIAGTILGATAPRFSSAPSWARPVNVPTETTPPSGLSPNPAADWLGPNTRVITNEAGDKVFLSENGTRRIRADFNRPSPHQNPHVHVEELINGRWRKSGPIYPTDVPPR